MTNNPDKTKEEFRKSWAIIESNIRECRKHVEPMLEQACKEDDYKLKKEDIEMLERFRGWTIRLLKLTQDMLKGCN